jgi:phage terminase small subunit
MADRSKQGHRYRQPVLGGANTLYGRLVDTAAELGLDPLRFEKATNHWMRHTYVRQALVDGLQLWW